MATVHQLLERHGRQRTLQLLDSDSERKSAETAAKFMADEDSGIGFVFSGWAQAALPHKRLADDAVWQLQTERVTLLVEPGRRAVLGQDAQWVGVPFGSRARLIMLYLQGEALKTKSREVELGRSLNAWLQRLGIPVGGKSFKDVREQAERISRCRLTFQVHSGERRGLINQNIVDTAMFVHELAECQPSLLLETARLSEGFYEQLQKHSVPLAEAAIRAINNNSMALDLYCWLAYRLHVLRETKPVTWKALQAQFGGGFARLDHFRTKFLDNLMLALAVYPEARVTADIKGLVLHPSPPPIAPRVSSGVRQVGRT